MAEATEVLQGQAVVWKHIFSFVDSMALKCAVELGVPDILHSHNRPLSLTEIASNISNTSSPNISYLSRIMRLLAHNKIFTAISSPHSGTLYGPSPASRWLLSDTNMLSLVPFLLLQNHSAVMSPWNQLSRCVMEGGNDFEKVHGCQLWDGLESVVDVGGGTGNVIAEIVATYKHISGINFDLPHVIQTAPEHPRVKHVAGDMFNIIPEAQAVFMKRILHCWNDEDCVKILKNCKKAIPEKTGKIIIVDLVLIPDGDAVFRSMGLVSDLLMMTHTDGGMERTEAEWKTLL